VKEKTAKKPVIKLTTEQKIRREIIAWFWVGLVFLLINGAIGQARVIPIGVDGEDLARRRSPHHEPHRLRRGIPFTDIHVPLWRNPKRQQIIIFKPPFDPNQPDYVKRVIGLPGDVVDVHDNAVWINGHRLEEAIHDWPFPACFAELLRRSIYRP